MRACPASMLLDQMIRDVVDADRLDVVVVATKRVVGAVRVRIRVMVWVWVEVLGQG